MKKYRVFCIMVPVVVFTIKTCRYTFNKHGNVFGVTVKLSPTQAIRDKGF